MLPDLGRLNIASTRAYDVIINLGSSSTEDDDGGAKRRRTDTTTPPMVHGVALTKKPEWLSVRNNIQGDAEFMIETVAEHRAVDDWKREFQCDVQELAGAVTETVVAPPGQPNMGRATWTLDDWKRIHTLEAARENENWIPPDGKPLRKCALRAIERLPLGLKPDQFYKMVTKLKLLEPTPKFIFSAMPIEPVQGQYALIQSKSGVVLFISISSTTSAKYVRQQILESVDAKEGSQLAQSIVFDNNVCEAVNEISKAKETPTGAGSSNKGSKLDNEKVKQLHKSGLFEKIANTLLNQTEVIAQMAYRTGLWKRATRLHLDNRPTYRDHVYETYYTLRSALAGVSMPVYAVDINQEGNMVVLMECGFSDLNDERKYVDNAIDRIMMNHNESQKNEFKLHVGAFLKRRLASASLATGEIGLLLTDSKPGNFLFQKCYYQIDVPGTNNTLLDLGILPVCVMATDIDPHYSFWFEHRQGVFLQPVLSRTDSLETKNLPMIDPQCVRYCNMAIFAMDAMCGNTESSWMIHMYHHCLIQADRYKNAVTRANKLVQEGPEMQTLCLQLHYNIKLDYVMSPGAIGGNHLKAWASSEYNSEYGEFENFVIGLALQIGRRIRHYGMGKVGDRALYPYKKCTGPLRVADPYKSSKTILGEVVAWMIEKAYEEANTTSLNVNQLHTSGHLYASAFACP